MNVRTILFIVGIILLIIAIFGIVGYILYLSFVINQYTIHYKSIISKDIYSPEITADTITDAIQLCGNKSDCFGFVWDVVNRKAYLRKGLSGILNSDTYDTYVKSVKNGSWPNG